MQLWNRADNHYLLESIAACDNKITNLVMYFTINMAFTNYLNLLPNLKNFMYDYANNKEIFDLKERHVSTVESLNNPNNNFFSNNYIADICVYILNNLTNINNLSYIPIL